MPRAERLLQDVAPRVRTRLAFVELALTEEPPDVRVVVRHLPQPAASGQMVDAAVPDVREVHPPAREPP